MIAFVVNPSGKDTATEGKPGSGGQSRSAPRTREIAWNIPEATSREKALTINTYQAAGVFVRAAPDGLIGYSDTSGKQKWQIEPAGGYDRICATSTAATDDVIGVIYGSARDDCGQVAAVNIRTGKQLWQSKADPKDELASGAAVAASDGKIFAPDPDGSGISGYDIEGKKRLWNRRLADVTCAIGDLAAHTDEVIIVEECLLDGTNELISLDPDTGKTNWKSKVQILSPVAPAEIVSVSPTVIQVGESSGQGELQVFDDSGSVEQKIPATAGGEEDLEIASNHLNSESSNQHPFPMQVVDNTLIALAWRSDPRNPDPGPPKVAGIDLTTGERSWTTDLPAGDWLMAPSPEGKTPSLVRFPKREAARSYAVEPSSGKVTGGDRLAKPESDYLSDHVGFVSTGKYLYQVRFNDLAYGPAVIAYK